MGVELGTISFLTKIKPRTLCLCLRTVNRFAKPHHHTYSEMLPKDWDSRVPEAVNLLSRTTSPSRVTSCYDIRRHFPDPAKTLG